MNVNERVNWTYLPLDPAVAPPVSALKAPGGGDLGEKGGWALFGLVPAPGGVFLIWVQRST